MASCRVALVSTLVGMVAGVAVVFAVHDLLRVDSNFLTAVATVALAGFAGVQVAREILGNQRRRAGTERRLTGAAWLARRSCEVTLPRGVGGSQYGSAQNFAFTLASGFTLRRPLNRLEGHFREVLALSSLLGGETGQVGARAFEGFLAAADRYNEIMDQGDPTQYGKLSDDALRFLYAVVDDLEELAPRHAFEVALPDIRTLGYRPGPAPGSAPPIPPSTTTPTP